ncbi:hypothetical protein EBB59_01355 [Lysobacter pythonis]|uniref:Uncharacterized protein n=1 Tax=Solilutibacter pythonis TaxID=2483112 RepID=A0A3M2I6X6_9GAMM|nr:hypothetical protein [Lysobacter pythonis]RMH94962.1 hypothetical protein EBB59_01355 [Lysobacter pythonis]
MRIRALPWLNGHSTNVILKCGETAVAKSSTVNGSNERHQRGQDVDADVPHQIASTNRTANTRKGCPATHAFEPAEHELMRSPANG